MKLNADILYESLSGQMAVKRLGADIKSLSLSPPIFFYGDTQYQSGRVYVGRPGELPPPSGDVACLIICVGGGLPARWSTGRCCVFLMMDETDILLVFNLLQMTYEKYAQWQSALQGILDSTASVEEMIHVSSPVFGNPIALCNNRLEIVAVSDPQNGRNIASVGPVPERYVQQFLASHEHNTSIRQPFVYDIEEQSVYCINIYKRDTYLGLIAMGDYNHPFRPGDFVLFGCFFEFVSAAAEKHLNTVSGAFVTLKSVFRDSLAALPLSATLVRKAMHREAPAGSGWLCAAVKLDDQAAQLPAEYLCSMVESHLNNAIALYAESHIAVFLSVRAHENDAAACCEALEHVLRDLSMRAGISYRFSDVSWARYHFRQAVCALETAALFDGEVTLCHFGNWALLYALHNSVGELPTEYLIPDSLLHLRKRGDVPGGTDYWKTLKCYLDNEMNATQTAKELFIHRTTLQTRLRKINESVDLSTPQSRMYIRYCIYLYEAFIAE